MLTIRKDRPLPVWEPPDLRRHVLTPRVNHLDNSIDYVKAVPLCVTDDVLGFQRLTHQIRDWRLNHPIRSMSWQSYVDAIADRCEVPRALEYLRNSDVPMGHFMHGDLTLENVLTDHHNIYLIDPNPGKYGVSSYWLDVGKIAFSMEYHNRFKSYWLHPKMYIAIDRWLAGLSRIWWYPAMVSHIVRLNGYQDQSLINDWLERCVS